MSEKVVVDASVETTKQVAKGVEDFIRKAWSIMDAASEKKSPSHYLSDSAIRSIQGCRE